MVLAGGGSTCPLAGVVWPSLGLLRSILTGELFLWKTALKLFRLNLQMLAKPRANLDPRRSKSNRPAQASEPEDPMERKGINATQNINDAV